MRFGLAFQFLSEPLAFAASAIRNLKASIRCPQRIPKFGGCGKPSLGPWKRMRPNPSTTKSPFNIDAIAAARALGGDARGSSIVCPGPGHSRRDRSMAVLLDPAAPDGFVVFSFAGDDPITCKDHVREALGLPAWRPGSKVSARATVPAPVAVSGDRSREELHGKRDDAAERISYALASTWSPVQPLSGTLGERYLIDNRRLDISGIELGRALGWHCGIKAVVALMTDPVSARPCGVHRTFLNPDSTKRERKMLGRQGVVRLSPDEDVTTGLGICEGTEDGIAILLSGWAPIWAATSAGAIAGFPVLAGVECLTIFADADDAGQAAAATCAARWREAGCEVDIRAPGSLT